MNTEGRQFTTPPRNSNDRSTPPAGSFTATSPGSNPESELTHKFPGRGEEESVGVSVCDVLRFDSPHTSLRNSVVLRMRADPEPEDAALDLNTSAR